MRYPVASPNLTGNELRYVSECVESTWVSSKGAFLGRFETMMREYVGVEHAVAACNGTVALHLAMLALGVGPGDEVIVPALTFVATAAAVRYCGATPVFADSDPVSWCVDPKSVERLITPRTKAVVAVHLFGQPCEMDALRALADAHGLFLVEDAAEALGATYRNRPVGSLADIAVLSFFGNKIITTGEGGMVLTSDAGLAKDVRFLCNHGMSPERPYWHPVVGYNYRLTNLAAALGVAQMERLDPFLAARRRLADVYEAELGGSAELVLPARIFDTSHCYWMYSVLVADSAQRDDVRRRLAEDGIETRPFFHPLNVLPPYRDCPNDDGCPVAEALAARGISLPTSTTFSDEDLVFIARKLLAAVERPSFPPPIARAGSLVYEALR